jgi:hypothetical protein
LPTVGAFPPAGRKSAALESQRPRSLASHALNIGTAIKLYGPDPPPLSMSRRSATERVLPDALPFFIGLAPGACWKSAAISPLALRRPQLTGAAGWRGEPAAGVCPDCRKGCDKQVGTKRNNWRSHGSYSGGRWTVTAPDLSRKTAGSRCLETRPFVISSRGLRSRAFENRPGGAATNISFRGLLEPANRTAGARSESALITIALSNLLVSASLTSVMAICTSVSFSS